MAYNPFTPSSTSVTLSVTDASARVPLAGVGQNQALIFSPAASDVAFVAFGDSTVVATTAGMAIPPGFNRVITIPPNATHIAGIAGATDTATIYLTLGDGN